MDDAWIPIIAFICLFGLPISGWIIIRVLQHRERMAMLERGMVPPPDGRSMRKNARYWQQNQQGPSAWTGQGAAPPYAYDDSCAPDVTLRKGIRTTMIGIAVFIGLSFIGWDGSDNGIVHWHPGPWLLGGLVPMFVGIAQIVNALLSGAQFGSFGMMQQPPPPNPAPPPYPNGSYSNYGAPPPPPKPGPQYEELKRPVPPPDRR